jgi:radical SAM protein with 4Fe4S-binding SPASM domain
MNGLSTVKIELTSKCNKKCWMCWRRNNDKDNIQYNDMSFPLLKSIAHQLPHSIVIQFHNDGEPLLYPIFGSALNLFNSQIKCMNTNGKLIVEKSDEIINNLDTMTVSVFDNDPEQDEQYDILKEFLYIKKDNKPNVLIRILGDVPINRYKKLNCTLIKRKLALPTDKYKVDSTIPEIGVCLDLLHHLVIRSDGKVSVCPTYDPYGNNCIGDCNDTSLYDIWNSEKRKSYIEYHLKGQRDKMRLCSNCEFWGVPTS